MRRFYLFILAGMLTLTVGCGKKSKPEKVSAAVAAPMVTAPENVISCAANEEALRAAIELSRASGKKEIVIADGVLALTAPIRLDARDKGLVVRGSGNTVLSGGVGLTFYAVEDENCWVAQLPYGVSEPYLLYVPGSGKRERAVFPRTGWLQNLDNNDLIWLGRLNGGWCRPPTRYELTQMSVTPDDLPDFEPADADVEVLFKSDSSFAHIHRYDPNLCEMVFSEPLAHPVGVQGCHDYRIHNVEPGMEPGKWRFHRATREIFYFPQGEENLADFHAAAAVVDHLVEIQGGEKITLSDLTFVCADAAPRGEGKNRSAVSITESRDIRLSNISISCVAGTAVEVKTSSGVTVEKCDVADAGKFGVYGENTHSLVVRESHFSRIGRTAIRVNGERSKISGNEIAETGYSGIAVSGDAEISGNRITRAMQHFDNGGAIQLDGGKNAKVSGNQIAQLPTSGLCHAICVNEATEFARIEKNRIESFFPVMVHCSRDIVLAENSFTAPKEMIFDLVNSDRVTLQKSVITAPKIIFSAPENALKRENDRIDGTVEERVKPRGFFFYYDEEKTLCCKQELKGKSIEPLKWKRIVCMGDSITAAGIFVYELQLYLACKFPQRGMEVINAGVSGETAAGGWERLPQVLALKPDAVILCYGMNDVGRSDYRDLWPESVDQAKRRERGIASCEKHLAKIISELQKNGIDVVLLPPFPYDEYGTRPAPDDNYAFCNSVALEKIALFCYAKYEGKLPLPLTRAALCRLYAYYPELCIAKDRVHPDARGHWLIADEIVHELFDRIPAETPLVFPLTEKMAEFFRLPPVPGVAKTGQLHPLRYLGKNGAVNAPTQILRQKMEAVAAAEGILNTMQWFDLQAKNRGIDPADFGKSDARLRPLAAKWGLSKTYEKYRNWRTRRAELAADAEKAREDFFRAVDAMRKKEK